MDERVKERQTDQHTVKHVDRNIQSYTGRDVFRHEKTQRYIHVHVHVDNNKERRE